jgi:hypothetical protein
MSCDHPERRFNPKDEDGYRKAKMTFRLQEGEAWSSDDEDEELLQLKDDFEACDLRRRKPQSKAEQRHKAYEEHKEQQQKLQKKQQREKKLVNRPRNKQPTSHHEAALVDLVL